MSATEHRTGIDDPDAVRSLLTSELAWDGQDLFEWRYDEFPGYDPDEHAFSVVEDGEVVAFRRVFDREVATDDGRVPAHVYGGTVVRPDHRGQGLYTELLERTNEYAERADVPIAMTFNRKGTITYEAKRERGWSARTLPLQLRVLSPSTVLEEYAGKVLDPASIPGPLARIGSRFHVDTCDGRVDGGSILRPDEPVPDRTLGVGLTNRAVTDFVEAAATDGGTVTSLLRTGVEVLRRRDVTVRSGPGCPIPGTDHPEPGDGLTVERRQELGDEEFGAALTLLDRDSPAFRRGRADLEHLLAYPGGETLVAYRGDELAGIAVLGPRENGAVTEGWLLELAATDDVATRALAERAVSRSADRGFDLVTALSPVPLGREWAAVDRQVLMWRPVGEHTETPFEVEELDVRLYDAL